MHTVVIDPEVLARAEYWRGKTHVFEDLDPRTTAHLVVDMQNVFTNAGAEMEVPYARDVIDNVNAVSAAVRRAGGLNIFVRMTIDERTPQDWSVCYAALSDPERTQEALALLRAGSPGWQVDPRVETADGDVFVEKTRYSAFVPGTSRLPAILQERGIETVIVSGTVTNVCCECNARDLMQHNYKVIFLSDATAAASDAEHNAALNNMVSVFADVMSTEHVVECLAAALAKPA